MKTDECINSDIGNMLMFYEMDMLSKEEKNEFEVHLNKCNYCNEMFNSARQIFEEMKKNPREYIDILAKKKAKKKHGFIITMERRAFRYSIAAIIAFISFWFIWPYFDTSVEYHSIAEHPEISNGENVDINNYGNDAAKGNEWTNKENDDTKELESIEQQKDVSLISDVNHDSRDDGDDSQNTEYLTSNEDAESIWIDKSFVKKIDDFASNSVKHFVDPYTNILLSNSQINITASDSVKIETALAKFRDGDYQGAKDSLDQMSGITIKSFYIGLINIEFMQWGEAITNLNKTTNDSELRNRAWFLLCLAYIKQGKPKDALRVIKNVTAQDNYKILTDSNISMIKRNLQSIPGVEIQE